MSLASSSGQHNSPTPEISNSIQAELRRLAAFKMPEEKVQCITRVSTIIMNLLSLAQDKSVPAADDFMPVLVFVSCRWNIFHILTLSSSR